MTGVWCVVGGGWGGAVLGDRTLNMRNLLLSPGSVRAELKWIPAGDRELLVLLPIPYPVLEYGNQNYCMVWMGHNLFNHSPTEGQLGCFQFLTITNKAALNIHVHVFVCT